MKKCPQCRSLMEGARENHRWDASGLTNLVLVDVEVHRCLACGEQLVMIPRIEDLHRAIAMTLLLRPGHMCSREVRFLRKWIGWSEASEAALDDSTVDDTVPEISPALIVLKASHDGWELTAVPA